MKRFTNFINEDCKKCKVGNELYTGITNHYMPPQNILSFINNVFCTRLSIVADIAEDGLSIKLTSSKFTSAKKVDEYLYMQLNSEANYNEASLYSYITSCGLTKVSKIDLGGYWVVYFSPADIKSAENPSTMCANDCCCPCPCEAQESLMNEFEIVGIIKEDDEEEMKSQTVEKVLALLDGPDKVKAAKQLELLVSNEIQLPREFYFAAIKFKSGEECIALRWKYTKKMPFGKAEDDGEYKETTIENTRSIMHIFGKGEKAIWVQDFDKESIIKLPDDVKKLIESILDLLEAGKTDDPAVWSLTGERKERDDDKDDKDEDNDEDKDKKDKDEDIDKDKDKDNDEDEDKNKDKDKNGDESSDDDSLF